MSKYGLNTTEVPISPIVLERAQKLARAFNHAWGETVLEAKSTWTQREIHEATLARIGYVKGAITTPEVYTDEILHYEDSRIFWRVTEKRLYIEVIDPYSDPSLEWILGLPPNSRVEDFGHIIRSSRAQKGITVVSAEVLWDEEESQDEYRTQRIEEVLELEVEDDDWAEQDAQVWCKVEEKDSNEIWVSLDPYHIEILHRALSLFVPSREAT